MTENYFDFHPITYNKNVEQIQNKKDLLNVIKNQNNFILFLLIPNRQASFLFENYEIKITWNKSIY